MIPAAGQWAASSTRGPFSPPWGDLEHTQEAIGAHIFDRQSIIEDPPVSRASQFGIAAARVFAAADADNDPGSNEVRRQVASYVSAPHEMTDPQPLHEGGPGPAGARARLNQVPRPVWMLGATVLGLVAIVALGLTGTAKLAVVLGLTEHAPLVLAAIGFALLYRLTGLLNVAYAETITLGAYFGMWLNTEFGLDFYTVLLPAGLMAGAVSVATYFVIFRPAKVRRVGALETIIISFGLSVFLRHALQFVFGYPVRFYDVPPPDTVMVLGVGVSSFRLLALASVAVTALVLYLFIQRSRFGLQIRALASDEDLAKASGIRPVVVTTLIWFIAGIAGGLAGAFYGVGSAVAPLLGFRQLLFILLVVLVGGIWGLRGVIVVGIITGISLAAMSLEFGQVLYAQLALIIVFLVLLKARGRRLAEAAKV